MAAAATLTDMSCVLVLHRRYFLHEPGVVYIDNFLTPEALAEIHRYCLQSTVFWDVRATYLGACA